MRASVLLCAAVAALAWSSVAGAATVTQRFTFTASDFVTFLGPSPAPVDPVSGVITITYDPDADTGPTDVGLVVDNLDIPFAGAQFNYLVLANGLMVVGTHPRSDGGYNITGPGDFGISFFEINVNPRFGGLQYATVDGGDYFSETGELRIATVPEPQVWALMIAGFSLAGGVIRRRHGARV